MERTAQTPPDEEPIGIIISGGSRIAAEPRLFAYVWGPVPDESELSTTGAHRAA